MGSHFQNEDLSRQQHSVADLNSAADLNTSLASADGCSPFREVSRMSRRQVLQAGTIAALGLGLPQLWQGRAQAEERSIAPQLGKAKACIFMFMWGGPSHIDTFDMKPNAPAEIRGSFNPINTNVPGIQICEHFGRLSKHADKLAIVRSLGHNDPAHLSSVHAVTTGQFAPKVNSDADPPSSRDFPHLGSVLAKLRAGQGGMPAAVTMPWLVNHPAAPGGVAPGQHGGWLGKSYDPFLVTGDPSDPQWKISALSLMEGLTKDRLTSRRELLQLMEAQRENSQTPAGIAMTSQQQKAFDLLMSPDVRGAFEITAEKDSVRERYGKNIHGQSVLLARRLVEHGVPLVTVNWHDDHRNFWDTHGDNFNRLKNDLIPPSDMAFSALLEDLDQRGMLDETLIVWVGEFGRNPVINAQAAGREHWPYCYSGVLAGGGINGGQVYGSSDSRGAYPAECHATPQDLVATIYHALGVSADTTLHDNTGRPHRLYGGEPLLKLFGA